MSIFPPTIFHITHWKAGSQWVRKILEACVPERIVAPQVYEVQFLKEPILEGRVYPTVYVTQDQFYSVQLPQSWKKFIIIRDLRDTLISVYFSIRFSHKAIADEIVEWRKKLEILDEENGLIYLLDEWLPRCAVIQSSWLGDQDGMLKYEDLVNDDIGIFENVLMDRCQLPVSRENLRRAVNSSRFESLTAGRQRGVEDVKSHERKGISGDWKNHFTDRLKEEFKRNYGRLLIDTGYEVNLDW